MAKGGRPTRYKKEYCETAKAMCLMGAVDAELASFFGVSEVTLGRWKKAHVEFCMSIKEGKEIADAKVALSLYEKATGYSHKETKFATHEGMFTDQREYIKHHAPDTTAAIFWLKNRQSEKWREKKEVEVTGFGIGNLIDGIQDE